MKIRFKNKISYEIHLDDNILHCYIPKLILQPFVENAILHGLEKKKDGGIILVSGVKKGDTLQFIIEDDGVGMDEAGIKNLLSPDQKVPLNTSVVTGGFSVKNVNERLKLIFEDKYTLQFYSEPGKGSRVEITVPAMEFTKKEELE
jgi:two-component system sensor histidine kinase YesM